MADKQQTSKLMATSGGTQARFKATEPTLSGEEADRAAADRMAPKAGMGMGMEMDDAQGVEQTFKGGSKGAGDSDAMGLHSKGGGMEMKK